MDTLPLGAVGDVITQDNNDNWPAYLDGSPVVYYTADGGTLCAACANGGNGSLAAEPGQDDPQWTVIGADVADDGEPRRCDHCNTRIVLGESK